MDQLASTTLMRTIDIDIAFQALEAAGTPPNIAGWSSHSECATRKSTRFSAASPAREQITSILSHSKYLTLMPPLHISNMVSTYNVSFLMVSRSSES